MNDDRLPRAAEEYLRRLRSAAAALPADRRDDLVADIREHLSASIPPDATEADVLDLLDRMGAPERIVEADPVAAAPRPIRRRGVHEWAAMILLMIGGVVLPVLGWFVGVLLLWTSSAWNWKDKLVGTFIPPGGFPFAAVLGLGTAGVHACEGPITRVGGGHSVVVAANSCNNSASPGWTGWLLLIVVAVAVVGSPIFTAVFLAVRARPRPA